MIQAQQFAVSQTLVRSPGVTPAQLYPSQVAAPAQAFDINTLLTAIMPLIMLVMVMQMMKPLMSGMAGSSRMEKVKED